MREDQEDCSREVLCYNQLNADLTTYFSAFSPLTRNMFFKRAQCSHRLWRRIFLARRLSLLEKKRRGESGGMSSGLLCPSQETEIRLALHTVAQDLRRSF